MAPLQVEEVQRELETLKGQTVQPIPKVKRSFLGKMALSVGMTPEEFEVARRQGKEKTLFGKKIAVAAGFELGGALGIPLAFAAGSRILPKVAKAIPGFQTFSDKLKRTFTYEFDIKQFPMLKEQVRYLKEAPTKVLSEATEEVLSITGKLNRYEYKLFRDIVINEDLLATANKGKAIPKTAEEVELALKTARRQAADNPKIIAAIGKHREITRGYGQELIKRGKLGDPLEEWYYPHTITAYEDFYGKWFGGIPRKIRKPFRAYTKERKGSIKAISEEYDDVMLHHIARIKLDNTLDDFIVDTATRFDKFPEFEGLFSKELRQSIFGKRGRPLPKKVYEIKGERYYGWTPEYFTRTLYPTDTVTEKTLNSLLDEIVDLTDVEGATGKSIREILNETGGLRGGIAIGAPKKTYLLPEKIAQKLESFRQPGGRGPTYRTIATMGKLWKRFTLDVAGLPFQFGNFVGDTINVFREDMGALTKFPDSMKRILRNSPATDSLMKEAEERAVLMSGITPESGIFGGKQLPARTLPRTVGRALGSPFRLIESFSRIRENIPRFAKFLKDAERIQQGKQIVTKTVDIAGLENTLAGAAKVSREALIDYGSLTKDAEMFRDLIFPFMTFYAKNANNWGKYIARNPGEFTAKFMMPWVGLSVWNNTVQIETEKTLSPWLRFLPHINTGWTTKEGKQIVIGLQTPVDMALDMFGLDGLLDKAARVADGRMTYEKAAEEQLKDMGWAPIKQSSRLLNPIGQIILGLVTGRDPFSKRKIIEPRLLDTQIGMEKAAAFVAEKLFAPFMQYQLMKFDEEKGLAGWPRALNPFAAAGIRQIDLDIQKQRRFREIIREEEKERDATLIPYAEELIRTGKPPPGKVKARDVINIMKRPTTYLEFIKKQVAAGKMPPEKLKEAEQKVTTQMFKQAPLSTRKKIIEEIRRQKLVP
tara:strand:+ start:4298 stop:7102 length:2805 start_codon:yes stop_codon:yes gene_type:complete